MSEDVVSSLVSMGFSPANVAKALEISEGNPDTAYELLSCGGLNEEEEEPQDYKMVILVRSDLNMGIGKVASQVAHAALGASGQCTAAIRSAWDNGGEAIIVLAVHSLEEMLQLEAAARTSGLGTYIVQDAGRTQVEEGTTTVCAIGPEAVKKVDQVTRHLKLL